MRHTIQALSLLALFFAQVAFASLEQDIDSLRGQARDLISQGNYSDAEERLREALSTIRSGTNTGSKREQMLVLKDLGSALLFLPHASVAAEKFLKEALSIANGLNDATEEANISHDLAIYYRMSFERLLREESANATPFELMDQYLLPARDLIGQASEINRNLKRIGPLADSLCELSTILRNVGIVYQSLGRPDLSRKMFNEGLQVLDEIQLLHTRPLIERGNLLVGLGREKEAQDAYRAVIVYASEHSHELLPSEIDQTGCQASQNLGILLSRSFNQTGEKSQANEALALFYSVAFHTENTVTKIPLDEVGEIRSKYFDGRTAIYEYAIDVLYTLGRYAEAVEWVERCKASTFYDILRKKTSIVSLRDESSHEILPTLKDNLPSDVAIVEFFLGRLGLYRFVLTADGIIDASKMLESGLEVVEDVNLLRKYMSTSSDVLVGGMYNTEINFKWRIGAHRLYAILLGGIQQKIAKCATVCIIPHHVLHYIPFHALPVDPGMTDRGLSSESPRFVVEVWPSIGYAPSIRSLVYQLAKRQKEINDILVIADPAFSGANVRRLPSTRETARFIQSISSEYRLECFVGNQVGVDEMRTNWTRSDFAYIGTHGRLGQRDPLDSSILFPPSKGRGPNEHFSVRDVLSIEGSPPEFLLLGACETALSDPNPSAGDDLMGVSRAFLANGVKGVVATLWSVPDKTTEEIEKGICRGILCDHVSGPQATSVSMKKFLERARKNDGEWKFYAHPFWWAGFAHYGDIRPW